MKKMLWCLIVCLLATTGLFAQEGEGVSSSLERVARWQWSNATMVSEGYPDSIGFLTGTYALGKWDLHEEYAGELHLLVPCGLSLKYNFVVQVQDPGSAFGYTAPGAVLFDQSGTYILRSTTISEILYVHTNCN